MSTTQTKTIIFALFWHAINCASTPQCVSGLMSTIKTKNLLIVTYQNCPKRSYVFDPPQRLDCFGRPNAGLQRWQNHCSIVTICMFLSRRWQRPLLCDQTLNQKKRELNVCLQRVHTSSSIQIQNGYVLCVLMCAWAQSWMRKQRIWEDNVVLKSWYHQQRISQVICGYSSAKVLINTPLRYSIWSNSLPKTQSAFLLVKKILTAK